MLGTTFGGNHLACAAGIAVLDIIKDEKLLENAAKMGEYLMVALRKVAGVKEVRGFGLMVGVELEIPCASIRNALLSEHNIFTGSSSDKNTIRILPALNIGEEELDIFLTAFTTVLSKTLVN